MESGDTFAATGPLKFVYNFIFGLFEARGYNPLKSVVVLVRGLLKAIPCYLEEMTDDKPCGQR